MDTTSNEKPKLLYVITKSNYGGAQRYVHQLATHFSNDYEVVVACGGRDILVQKLHAERIRTIEIRHFQRDVSLKKEFWSIRELWQLFRSERPAIVHLNSSKAGLLGAIVARLAGVPYIIYTVHGWAHLESRPRWWKFLTWLGSYVTILFVHRAIPISRYDTNHSYLFGLRHKLLPVTHNGIRQETLIPKAEARYHLVGKDLAETHRNDLWLVSIAELHPNKNIIAAIEAVIAHNRDPETKQRLFYVVMGDGSARAEIEAYIRHHHASDDVFLCGFVLDAKRYLLAGDVFILPSRKEGLPYAILEAGAAGLPVIASNVCGIPEIITNGTHGILFAPDDKDALIQALGIMAHQPITRATYSTVLHERIIDEFSEEKMLNAIARYYKHR
jgi:glycosyltransferase involved in cell wall biosynthesis